MNLLDLPEVCIANILSFTTPRDAFRLSSLCKIFKSAAKSDAVWDKFLPPEIHTILSQSGESGLLAARSKKELYLALCNKPLLIDDGKLSFSLDKRSGKKCYMISARDLRIVWGDDPRYWKWTSHPESRFQEVAELLLVGWLEISGKLETRLLSPSTLYKAYLVVKFTRNAFGFKHLPGEVSVGLEGGERTKQTLSLHIEGEINSNYEREMAYSIERGDAEGDTVREVVINDDRYLRESPEWLEIELGEFFSEGGEDGLLKMRYVAKGSVYWKSGLIVQGIEVRPQRNFSLIQTMNPPTSPPPPATSGGQDPSSSTLNLESVRPGAESFIPDDVPLFPHGPTARWRYDVFLSFSGEDTPNSFTEHLCRVLDQKGITFRGDELEPGEPISPSVLKAIEESICAIVILSPNYANSTRCLDELAKAVECMRVPEGIVPVFYDVDEADVKNQSGSFGEAISQLGRSNPGRIRRWRSALKRVGHLSGWYPRKSRDEGKIIQEIVEKVVIELAAKKEKGLADPVKVSVEEDLIQYCCLFPSGYEFREDELVQLWIAEGLIKEESDEKRMEDTGIDLFNSLVHEDFLVRSRCDFKVDFDSVISVPMYSPSTFFYKVNPVKLLLSANKSSPAKYCRAIDGKFDEASESMTQHLSLVYEDIDEMTFVVLQKFKNLRTLLLLSGRGSSIKRIPGELFSSLNFLTTLNLSRTLVSGLPSSVGDVKPLRYLDVSYTLITRLPESIGTLENLQTLKLRGCKDLFDLPRSVHNLTALRHLDFDIIRQLDIMPAQLGKLSNLQSLSAFLVGRDDGRRIQELKNLNDLGGALRIFRLENVSSRADAVEVDLENKKRLQRLDFRWTKLMGENEKKMQEEILDSLRPPTGLKELQILFYSGTKFPSWLSDTSITDLVLITLYKCANCEHLPSLGRLPNLKFLSIVEMNEVKEIAPTFFRSLDHPKSLKAFPKLEILEVDSMLNLKDWKEVQEGDLESLIKLTMESCPELVTVPSFSGLKTLKYLEFNHCPELLSLNCNAVPTSLESLIIRDCPKLKEWSHKGGHQDLRKLKSRS